MASSGRLTLIIGSTATALAGAAAMYALSLVDAPRSPPSSSVHQTTATPPAAPNVARMSFVPPGAFAQLADLATAPWQTEMNRSDTESHVPWSMEILAERISRPPPSRAALLPHPSLPWSTPRPGTPKRFYTLKARLAEIAPGATLRLAAKFEAAKASFPPTEIALIAIKDEKVLELHARGESGGWKLIHRYRVLAASGGIGPKLRQGDKQVPEGIYAISFLNPNSAYHVSMRVNFPNAFDRQMAAKDARSNLGGDIMIHGKNLSAGCLAMGDEAVEELFVLAARTGLSKVKLIIAPTDMRQNGIPAVDASHPAWVPKLYTEIASAMSGFQPPETGSKGLLSFFMK